MIRMLRLSSVLVLVAFALSACDDDDNDKGGGAELDPQERFGSAFAKAFNAGGDAEPIDPTRDDLDPVSFTDDPIDF